MALVETAQEDFSAGIHRGREAPANAAYDLVNFLIDDEGQPYRRGGSAFHSASNAGVTLGGIANMGLVAPDTDRTLMWGGTKLYVLDGTTPVELYDDTTQTLPYGRPVGVGGVMVFPISPLPAAGIVPAYNRILAYGGSLVLSGGDIGVGTITVTADSVAVTKSGGASWVGMIDPGMFILLPSGPYAIVRSVDGANALTLVSAYSGSTTSTTNYTIQPTIEIGLMVVPASTFVPAPPPSARVFVGSSGTRLLVGAKNRIYPAERGFPFPFDQDLYHELPAGAEINGIEGLGDTGLVFTTKGVWGLTNMSLDLIDAYGNIQQGVERLNGDLILWGEHGVTSYAGGVIVPCFDDIHIMGSNGASEAITGTSDNERIRRLYRSYTKTAGYQPGPATVHRGHLFMPIVNGTTVVDTLVCRMDRGQAWTRWAGHASGPGYAVKPGSASTAPKLLGLAAQRVTDLTGCFDPSVSNATDADGTTSDCVITTRDFPLGGDQPGFCQRVRARYELTDGGSPDPTVAIAYSSDQDAGAWTNLTEKAEQGGAAGWAVSDGSKYQWGNVGKRRERIRFRITVAGAAASFVLRSIKLLSRPHGGQ